MSEPIIASLGVSPTRRGLALIVMMLLGFLLLYLTVTTNATILHKAFLIIVAAAVLWVARTMQRGTGRKIQLRRSGLFFDDGQMLASLETMLRGERSAFAFKPSNGFVISLDKPCVRAWVPGLYWQFGKRIGIGGVTSPSEGKFVADALAVLIAEKSASERL